jgi:hypothetical protein
LDVSIGCCASTGCSNPTYGGGCGTGGSCSPAPFNRCASGWEFAC